MRYAGMIENDVVNGEGICTSFFVQGCPRHCPGCFNPETWDFGGGYPLPADYKERIKKILIKNNIQRNFSILGGEPLCNENKNLVNELVSFVRQEFPHIKIYLWTGYKFYQIREKEDLILNNILNQINYIIDGEFIESLKDLTLELRGSTNQHIWQQKNGIWYLIK